MRVVVLIALLFSFLASNDKPLEVIFPKDFPPQYIYKDNKPTGLAIDILDYVAKESGLHIKYFPKENWQHVWFEIKNGKFALVPDMGVTPEREEFVSFSKPINTISLALYVNSISNIKIMEDLENKTIGVVKNNLGEKLVKKYKNSKVKTFTTFQEAFVSLKANDIQALIYPQRPIENLIKLFKVKDNIYEMQIVHTVTRAIGISKANEYLLEDINKAIDKLFLSGEYEKLMKKWYESEATKQYSEEEFQSSIKKYIAMIIILFLIAILIGGYNLKLKKLQKNLIKLNTSLKKAQKIANLGFWEFDYVNNKLDWSDEIFEIFEISKDSFIVNYENFLSFVHPEDREALKKAYKSSIENKTNYNFTHRIITAKKNIRYVKEECEHVFNEFGELKKSFGTVQNITLLEESKNRYKENQKLLQVIMDSTDDLIFYKDKNFKYIGCNDAFAKFVGKDKEFIIGKVDFELFDTETAGHFRRMDKECLAKGEPRKNIEMIELPQNKNACVETNKIPLKYNESDIGIMGISRDITTMIEYQEMLKSSEGKIKSFIEKNQAIILVINPQDGKIDYSNKRAQEFYCYEKAELESMKISDINILNSEQVQEEMDKAILERRNFFVFKHRLGTGMIKDVHVYSSPIEFEGKKYLFSIIFDVTQKLQNEKYLKLLANIFTETKEGIMITNEENVIIDVNRAFLNISGYTKEDVLGYQPNILKSGKHSDEFYQQMWESIEKEGSWRGEIYNRRKGGEVYPETLSITTIKNDKGQITNYIGIFSDISEQKKYEKKLEFTAYNDSLTKLPNRTLFLEKLTALLALAKREKTKLAVLYIDIDGFKAVNDNYGHDVGDKVLIKVARSIEKSLREADLVSRFGGDEFVAYLSNIEDEVSSLIVINRILQNIKQCTNIDDNIIDVSASIGVSFYPQKDSLNAEKMIRQADHAMYQAKQAGKNRYYVFDEQEDKNLREYHQDLEKIRLALERKEFVLYYQPKVDMRTGKLVGVEALIRWQDSQRGLIFPNNFLPIIENHPLSIAVSEWVIDTALSQLSFWSEKGIQISMSVNISTYHLRSDGFTKNLKKVLKKYKNVSANQLELEILETSAIEDLEATNKVLNACRDFGVQVAIDDFGTGYSSLTYIKQLDIDTLKIDKSFVIDILNDIEDMVILRNIINLAKAFDHTLIAEGVESAEHGKVLLQLGCSIAQGYYISKPIEGEKILTWYENWKPDIEWSIQKEINNEDITLMFAITKHRTWMAELFRILQYDDYISINLDKQECRFGLWLKNYGENLYGDNPVFKAVKKLHNEIHEKGLEIIHLKSMGKVAEAKELYTQIEQTSERMIENINYII
jgi:diguanylate cyclase (GGDEF)-like protein/PAS domain S-box-containing protein